LARRVSVASARRAPAADPASRSALSVDRHEPATQRLLEAESRRSQLEIELEASRERSGAEDPALARRFVEATHHVMDAINERRPLRLFVSYSHADDEHATQLVQHMASLRNEGLATWYDRRIQPGADWETEISVALDESDVAIFLISAAFLSSPYCTGVEWQRAVERARQGRLVIVPVIVRACDWKHLVGHVQVLPHDGKPVASHPDRDEAYLEVVTQMKELILTLRRARSQESSR